jgi:hypothetical protein
MRVEEGGGEEREGKEMDGCPLTTRWINLCPPCWYFSPGCRYEVSILVLCACHYSVSFGPFSGILSFGLPLLPPPSPS